MNILQNVINALAPQAVTKLLSVITNKEESASVELNVTNELIGKLTNAATSCDKCPLKELVREMMGGK